MMGDAVLSRWAKQADPFVEVRVPTPFAGSPEFLRLLEGDPRADLTLIALEIARDAHPGLIPGTYLDKIDEFAERVRQRCPSGASPGQVIGQINWVLFIEERFQGSTEDYYNPRNSYLNEVIDRREGIPISLSVLYRAVAERLALTMDGVNLPAHFILRTGQGPSTLFVDPFHGGALLDRQGCERRIEEVTEQAITLTDQQLEPAPLSLIVARILRNLKAVYLRDQEFTAVLPVLRRLVALVPDDPLEHRDLGVSCLRADRPGEAIDPLAIYLNAKPGAKDAEQVRALLRAAWQEVASSN
ncbi:MAG: transglutaminase-like domain-containing protein [Isosphaeraceae bacterium]